MIYSFRSHQSAAINKKFRVLFLKEQWDRYKDIRIQTARNTFNKMRKLPFLLQIEHPDENQSVEMLHTYIITVLTYCIEAWTVTDKRKTYKF